MGQNQTKPSEGVLARDIVKKRGGEAAVSRCNKLFKVCGITSVVGGHLKVEEWRRVLRDYRGQLQDCGLLTGAEIWYRVAKAIAQEGWTEKESEIKGQKMYVYHAPCEVVGSPKSPQVPSLTLALSNHDVPPIPHTTEQTHPTQPQPKDGAHAHTEEESPSPPNITRQNTSLTTLPRKKPQPTAPPAPPTCLYPVLTSDGTLYSPYPVYPSLEVQCAQSATSANTSITNDTIEPHTPIFPTPWKPLNTQAKIVRQMPTLHRPSSTSQEEEDDEIDGGEGAEEWSRRRREGAEECPNMRSNPNTKAKTKPKKRRGV